jgi:hypothetical protein
LQADYKEREEDFVRGYDIMTSLAWQRLVNLAIFLMTTLLPSLLNINILLITILTPTKFYINVVDFQITIIVIISTDHNIGISWFYFTLISMTLQLMSWTRIFWSTVFRKVAWLLSC